MKMDHNEEVVENNESGKDEEPPTVDIMAQQLKFVACLKILMEELSTLATGFEVDGKLVHLCYLRRVKAERVTKVHLKYLAGSKISKTKCIVDHRIKFDAP